MPGIFLSHLCRPPQHMGISQVISAAMTRIAALAFSTSPDISGHPEDSLIYSVIDLSCSSTQDFQRDIHLLPVVLNSRTLNASTHPRVLNLLF